MGRALDAIYTLGLVGIALCAQIARADPPRPASTSSSESAERTAADAPSPAQSPVVTPEQIWIASLDAMPAGGWQYLFSSTPGAGESVVYVSTHNVTVHGSIVTAWFRWEYMTALTGQPYTAYQNYRSYVTRTEIACEMDATRDIAVSYYSDNNLQGTLTSQVADPKTVQWEPAVPGTLGEAMVGWGCAQMRSKNR